jgi:hypothetical protein
MADRDLTFEMKRIQSTWTELSCRSSAEIQADHAQLSEAISQIYASCVTRAVS